MKILRKQGINFPMILNVTFIDFVTFTSTFVVTAPSGIIIIVIIIIIIKYVSLQFITKMFSKT